VEAELTQTRRFGQDDTEFAAGGSIPLGAALTLSGRISASPTHCVLAKGSAGVALQWEFRPAWLLHGGFRHTNYNDTDVNQGSVMLEHYFGNWSVLGAAHRSRAFGERVFSYELRGSYYYGDGSSIGLFLGNGDEVAQTGPGTVAISSVRSVALVGHHLLGGPWSLRYGLHHVRQGSFYDRSGASLGVQYAF
jgi:YaiO family outer membrane protein